MIDFFIAPLAGDMNDRPLSMMMSSNEAASTRCLPMKYTLARPAPAASGIARKPDNKDGESPRPTFPRQASAFACSAASSGRTGQCRRWKLVRREEQPPYSRSTRLPVRVGSGLLQAVKVPAARPCMTVYPPPTNCTISTCTPSQSPVSAHSGRFKITRSNSTNKKAPSSGRLAKIPFRQKLCGWKVQPY